MPRRLDISHSCRHLYIETQYSSSEHGLATHFIPARRIPQLLDRLVELHQPHASVIDRIIEDLSSEREAGERPAPFIGAVRTALDIAFRHNKVEAIISELEAMVGTENREVQKWATDTLEMLHLRSPTSLKVALQAIRRGRKLSLRDALDMELKIATAFCVSRSLYLILSAEHLCSGVQVRILPRASKPCLSRKAKNGPAGPRRALTTFRLRLSTNFSTRTRPS